MAVEARCFSFLPQQLVQEERGCVDQGIAWPNQIRFHGIPFAGALQENLNPAVHLDSVPAKADSALTCNVSAGQRKRSRESFQEFRAAFSHIPAGADAWQQIQRQSQSEMDAIIAQHTKKVRLGYEIKHKEQTRLIAAAMGHGLLKKLREKDDEIQRIGKLNLVLQERVKSLYVENQLLRDLAQSSEATANSLRTNLEQVLQQVADDRFSAGQGRPEILEDDAESVCDSSNQSPGDEETTSQKQSCSRLSDRRCRRCGEREASVLVLPCRHLCLCNICGSGSHQLKACPVCDCPMNATLYVNMAS
ncbi:hypothetical protein M569_09492 [Genlisea aurea]|uniref:RING-type domain-containing protein n=1 Tax=Genlisea aurea TaxID=192259 RepID=S8CEJ9_9LAMI|nr:hypothetical protein M569_09492 [Genlisea aurea]